MDFKDVDETTKRLKQTSTATEDLIDKNQNLAKAVDQAKDALKAQADAHQKLATSSGNSNDKQEEVSVGLKAITIMGHDLPPTLLAIVMAVKKLKDSLKQANSDLMNLARQSPYFSAQMSIINFEMSQFGIIIGNSIAPALQPLINLLQKVLNYWNSLSPAVKQAIKNGIMVAAVIVMVAAAFLALDTAMLPITAVIIGIVAAVAILSLAWSQNWGNIHKITSDSITAIVTMIDNVLKPAIAVVHDLMTGDFVGAFSKAVEIVYNLFEGFPAMILKILGSILTNLGNTFNIPFLTSIGNLVTSIGNLFSNMGKAAADIISGILHLDINEIKKGINLLLNANKSVSSSSGTNTNSSSSGVSSSSGTGHGVYAAGGYIPGNYSQPVPIIAHGSELVLNPSQQRNLFAMANGNTTNNSRNSHVNITIHNHGGVQSRATNNDLMSQMRSRGLPT